jgi:sortase B
MRIFHFKNPAAPAEVPDVVAPEAEVPAVEPPGTGSARKPKDVRNTIRIVIRFLALVVLVGSVVSLAVTEYRSYLSKRNFDDIRDSIPTEAIEEVFHHPTDAVVVTPEPGETYETLLSTDLLITSDGVMPQYVPLYRQNPQLAGWIRFPGWKKFPIDYPIMFSGDNAFYLRRDFTKNNSSEGCIFMDGSNDPRSIGRNLVVYGHAMRSKTMFGNIEDYPENTVSWSSRHTIYIDLLWTRLEYEVFSTYYTSSDEDYRRTYFSTDEDFGAYADLLKSRSAHDFGVEVGPRDRILTLSTCQNYVGHDRRVAVHAKLVRRIVFNRSNQSSAEITGVPEGVTGAVVPTNSPTRTPTPGPTSEIPSPSVEPTVDPTPEVTPDPAASPTPDASLSPTLTPDPAASPTLDPNLTPTIFP